MTSPTLYAAPSPLEDDGAAPQDQRDLDLDALCERWVYWCRTRRMYGPAPISGTVLGKMSGSTRPVNPHANNAMCSPEMSAFHIAYTCQPRDALDRQVFDAYYVYRVKPIKSAADALGISRQHFYALLSNFRIRVAGAADAIQAENRKAAEQMQERRLARHDLGVV